MKKVETKVISKVEEIEEESHIKAIKQGVKSEEFRIHAEY